MRKLVSVLGLLGLVAAAVPIVAQAAVTPSNVTSMVTSATNVKASSAPVGLFSLNLSQTASETLSSVAVTLANQGSSNADSSDFAKLEVYKDNGNGIFEPGVDVLAGSQTSVLVGSPTVVNTPTNNVIDGGKFFVALSTSGSWNDTAPGNSVTATLATNAITTSANSPTISGVVTAAITADVTVPTLSSVVAQNTGGTAVVEAGDSLVFTFSEATNKPAITNANIASIFALSNSHSLLDGAAGIGSAVWNSNGTVLTLTLSGATSVPTVVTGDTVTIQGTALTDVAGNVATGNKVISGSFGSGTVTTTAPCTNGIVNGVLYKARGQGNKVFQGVNCALVPFTGSMSTFVHGHKKAKKTFMLSFGQFKKAHHEDERESHGRGGDR